MARVICPMCHRGHTTAQCDETGYQIPEEYIANYRTTPPLWLTMVGFSKHGKTTYLAALALMLEHLPDIVPGSFYYPLDNKSLKRIREMRLEADEGVAVRETQIVSQPPLLLTVENLPEERSRCLVMYDVAGEIFDELHSAPDFLPALKHVNTTWFLVSLWDIEHDPQRKILDLLTSYVTGMQRLGVPLKGQNLVIVYTKADKSNWDPQINDYLLKDPYMHLTAPQTSQYAYRGLGDQFDMLDYPSYLAGMYEVSAALEQFTAERVPSGRAFINMARARGINLRFCITSATGQDPDQGRFSEQSQRIRVLDPFWWVLELDKQSKATPTHLIFDAGDDSEFGLELINTVWESLSDQADVTTYHAGRTIAISRVGQLPPDRITLNNSPLLIGSILDTIPKHEKIVLVTNRYVHDLVDFRGTNREDRLLIVATNIDAPDQWRNRIVFQPNDDVREIVKALFTLEGV